MAQPTKFLTRLTQDPCVRFTVRSEDSENDWSRFLLRYKLHDTVGRYGTKNEKTYNSWLGSSITFPTQSRSLNLGIASISILSHALRKFIMIFLFAFAQLIVLTVEWWWCSKLDMRCRCNGNKGDIQVHPIFMLAEFLCHCLLTEFVCRRCQSSTRESLCIYLWTCLILEWMCNSIYDVESTL